MITIVTVGDINERKERLQTLSNDLAVVQERQRQLKEQLEDIETQLKSIVGDQDPMAYLAHLESEVTGLREKVDRGLEEAELLIGEMQ